MSNKLHQIVQDYVQIFLNNNSMNTKGFESEQIKSMLIESLEHDIREEILKEEVSILENHQKKIQAELETEFANKRLKEKIEEANEIAFIAMFAGLVIGLVVNQTTDLMSLIKSTLPMNSEQIIITLVIIVLLLLVVYWCYKRVFIDRIAKIIQEKYKN